MFHYFSGGYWQSFKYPARHIQFMIRNSDQGDQIVNVGAKSYNPPTGVLVLFDGIYRQEPLF